MHRGGAAMSEPQQGSGTADQGPGVLVRPPLLYTGTLIAAVAIDLLVLRGVGSTFGLTGGPRFLLGLGFLIIGVVLMAAAMTRFGRAGTPVRTSEATQALVTDGVYRLSRNPIYLGLTANYLGITILADAPVALLLLVPVLLVMRFGVIAREERYLSRKYGETYLAFRRRTGRWLGPI